MKKSNIGVLITNVGSPDTLTLSAVKNYLKKFLSDRRVVAIPRCIWWPILYGYILRTRPKTSLELYKKIWTKQGSPLTISTQQLANRLQSQLALPVAVGMHYANPSIEMGLNHLTQQGVQKIITLPLFPQYSGTTTAVTFDQVASALKKQAHAPELIRIHDYHHHPAYIQAISDTIRPCSVRHLLFSFHGVPEYCIKKGDPYAEQCHTTARLIAEKLNLSSEQWSVSFQSRLGRTRWLKPYTDQLLMEFPKRGITDLHVICPGFAIDCLETLEEIAIRGKKQFLAAGGISFQYIPALNTLASHLKLIKHLIETC